VMRAIDCEGAGEFPGAGTPCLRWIVNSPARAKDRPGSDRLQRAHEHKPQTIALDQNVEKPVHAVVEIHISCPRRVRGDKRARRRACGSVTSRVVLGIIRLSLDNDPLSTACREAATNQLTGAVDGIPPKKLPIDHRPLGRSMKSLGSANRLDNSAASALTPKISVA